MGTEQKTLSIQGKSLNIIREAWRNIPDDYLLMTKLAERDQAVVKNKGGHTKD